MPETATLPTAGLFRRDRTDSTVPLTGVSVDAHLSGFYARVVVSHRYVNRETTPIEAVYVFPLEEAAAVCGFEAIVDGTLVVGEVHEREQAFEIYDNAMEQGHGAFLLDEERSDVFQASIGNLPPGKEVLVRLTYVAELGVDDGRLRFVIPTTVSPRYAPAVDCTGVGRPDAETLNPPTLFSVPYGMNLSIRLGMPGAISRIESPSHPISVTVHDREAVVTLGQSEVALDRDFVLSIDAAGLEAPQAIVEREDDGTEAVGVAFAPRFETTSAPAELIFVVDRSGSMEGTSITEVRNALQLCLRSLTSGCRFNIVGFGSRYESLFPDGSRPYEQSTLDGATQYVAALQADLGGTEMLPALAHVLEQPALPGLPRQIVLLTDGEVTNTDALLAVARSHAAAVRIFTFGIGAGASHHLVRGLARAGGGAAEFIHPGERIEPKVLRQVARLLSPALTDVQIDWAGGTVTQAPLRPPAIFANGRVAVYGFVKGARPTSARLTARSRSGRVTFDVPIPEPVVRATGAVATLAARARIRELEEGSDWLSARGSQQRERKAQAKSNSARDEIIALGVRYKLISRETSFVAVERRDTPVAGEVKLRRIPIALTTGWGGVEDSARFAMASMMRPVAMPASAMPGVTAMLEGLSSPMAGAGRKLRRLISRSSHVEELSPPPRQVAGPSLMQRLIVLQAADGSWRLTKELASILGWKLAQLETEVRDATGPRDQILRAWATALAIVWLEKYAADAEDEWRLLATKARAWLQSTSAQPSSGTWMGMAKGVLGAE